MEPATIRDTLLARPQQPPGGLAIVDAASVAGIRLPQRETAPAA